MVMPETMYLNRPLTIGWRDIIQFAVSFFGYQPMAYGFLLSAGPMLNNLLILP